MCSIIGEGERLHKVLGQIDLGTLDSRERSLPFGLLVCFNFLSDFLILISFRFFFFFFFFFFVVFFFVVVAILISFLIFLFYFLF